MSDPLQPNDYIQQNFSMFIECAQRIPMRRPDGSVGWGTMNVCVIEATRKRDGKAVPLMCYIIPTEDGRAIVPIGEMFENENYDADYQRPEGYIDPDATGKDALEQMHRAFKAKDQD